MLDTSKRCSKEKTSSDSARSGKNYRQALKWPRSLQDRTFLGPGSAGAVTAPEYTQDEQKPHLGEYEALQ